MTILKTGCKINLGLRIHGLRPDGYHVISSLFYPLPYPTDHLIIQKGERSGLNLECSLVSIKPEKNLIYLAYREFAISANFYPAINCRLVKRVPAGAGLGGGSANAGKFLLWLNQIAPNPIPDHTLLKIAARVGADVPFFLQSQPCAVSGIGEKLRPLKFSAQNSFLLLVLPPIFISTPLAFSRWDDLNPARPCLTDINNPDKSSSSDCISVMDIDCANDLEQAVYNISPELAGLKSFFLHQGALQAGMSGSGAAHYGIFANRNLARKAAASLHKRDYFVACMPMPDFGM